MNISESKYIDQIIINELGVISYRENCKIVKNGAVIAQTYHRSSVEPGDYIEDEPEDVKNMARFIWTDEVVEVFLNSKSYELDKGGD